MSKKRVVFQSPILTQSGYGHRARDIAKCLLSYEEYTVYFIPTNWGSSPWTGLSTESEFGREVSKRIILQLDFKPDIFIQHTIPNEFNPIGDYNIGITAGIETDTCAPAWIEGMNKMDLIIGSTNHSVDVLKRSAFSAVDKRTNQVTGQIKVNPNVQFKVLLEALDSKSNKNTESSDEEISGFMDKVKSDYAFLFVGHWMAGDFLQDRKDVAGLIKTFVATFQKKPKSKQPALILKTSSGALSVSDEMQIKERIAKLCGDLSKVPPIYLLYGDLSNEEMTSLYKHPKVKAMVSFTKGEGFGRPLAEFAAVGKPVITSGWSGQLDFILPEYHTLLFGELNEVHESVLNDWFIKGAKWFTVDYAAASNVLKDIHKNYNTYLKKARKGQNHIKSLLSFDKMNKDLRGLLHNIESNKPDYLNLKLPKL